MGKGSGAFLKIGISVLLVTIGSGVFFYMLQQKMVPSFFGFKEPSKWDNESKFKVLGQIAKWLGAYLFLQINLVSFFRIFTFKPDPCKTGDNYLTDVSNKALRNTIEQYAIFALNLIVFVFNNAEKQDVKLIYSIVFGFLVGRVTFTLGYLSGAILKTTSLRGFGNGFSLGANILLAAANFGHRII